MEQIINKAVVEHKGGKRLKRGGGDKLFIALCIIAGIVLAGYLGLCAYAGSLDTFYPNYRVNGIDVGGLTVSEAQEKIETELLAQTVEILDPNTGAQMVMTLEEIGLTAERLRESSVAQASMDVMRKDGFGSYGYRFVSSMMGNGIGGLWPGIPYETLQQTAEQISAAMSQETVDSSYEVLEDSIRITRAKDGYDIDPGTLAGQLQNFFDYGEGPYQIEVFSKHIPAKTLSAKAIHQEVAAEMKNAGYDAATDTITPEQMGADFDVAAAQKALDGAAPGETVTVPADIRQPEVTAEHLKEVLFRDVLGEARTHVSGTAARISNVKLSAASINNYVMNTGDVFSYNEVVGKRTAENGYQAAPAYVKGETVDEIGGGICQTSSTLYYACLLGDLEITERYAHRYVPAYILWGADATVSWGGPDYKFTNQTPYPIKIVTEYNKGYLTVKVLGTNTTGQYAKVTNKVLETTPWETVYEEDETIAPGKEEVKTTPYTGYKVETYHTIYDKDGKIIDSHFEATSNYKVRNKVILRSPATAVVVPGVPAIPDAPVMEPVVPEEPTTPPAFFPTEPDVPEEEGGFIIVPAFPDEEV